MVVDLAVEVGVGVAVLVGADVDLAFHHLVLGLQGPDAVLLAAAQAGRRVARQLDAGLVMQLVVVEFDDVEVQAFVAGEAVPDADFGQQAGDEGQVAFAVLHDLQAPGVLAGELEVKILAPEIVAAAQDVFDDFRHGLVLIEAELLAAGE